MPRILTDQDFDEDIARGLARRVTDLDWQPLRALADRRSQDEVVLRVAFTEERIVLSHDVRTLYPLALRLAGTDAAIPRVVAVPRTMPIGAILEQLEVLLGAGTDEDWGLGVVRLPLW